jgi:hypothetical protein
MLQFKFKHAVVALFGAGTLALASVSAVDTAKADESGVSKPACSIDFLLRDISAQNG